MVSCSVSTCDVTRRNNPNKNTFHRFPRNTLLREKWLRILDRDRWIPNKNSTICSKHFESKCFIQRKHRRVLMKESVPTLFVPLPKDMENYMEYHVMGSVSQVRMKVGCMPKKFKCQPDRTTLTSDTTKELCEVKKQMKTLDECEKRFEEDSIVTEQSEEMASSSSVQHNVEEVPQLTSRVLDTSIQVKTFKAFRGKANETQLPKDMDNNMRYRILGTVSQVRMIPGCTPSKFECQPDRKRRTCGGKERPYILKKNRIKAVEECMNKSEIKSTSCSTLQDTSNINCHTVEEHAEDISCKQEEKSVQIMTLKSKIKEDFENKNQDDDILNLHTTIDIKQDIEDIDSSGANLSSASSSRTNSACGSPTRESHIETFTEYESQTTIDVTVMKEEPGSPISDVSIHSGRDILTEIAADVYQQHRKKQFQQNKKLTQIRHANCERQRRYREKQKAAKMKAYATISGSSKVQQHKRRPQTNAERTKKHRKLLREQQQQRQMGDINVVTLLSNKNFSVDPTARARNARKLHLNKLRQGRFRARQKFKSPITSSQQAQEFVTQESLDHDRHQDALENLCASDPSQSTGSYLQTIMRLKREINKDFDLQESHGDILNLHTHVEIKQEDLEDIDSSVANLSSASCSQTNSACESPTRESHIETFTEYEPQTTIDVTAMKEEPGSLLSDVSIHSEAADSPEEEAIEIKLRKKMAMLSQNEEIIKRRREEISILENKNKQLLADIKYLQNVSKKKCYYPELN